MDSFLLLIVYVAMPAAFFCAVFRDRLPSPKPPAAKLASKPKTVEEFIAAEAQAPESPPADPLGRYAFWALLAWWALVGAFYLSEGGIEGRRLLVLITLPPAIVFFYYMVIRGVIRR